jgi:phosphohistidine phosphatase
VKTLLLVRHAKSDWGDPALGDHERPLNGRGLRDAPEMGRRLREGGVVPGAIRSSTAVRARSTATLMAEQLGLSRDVVVPDERLYGSSPETIMTIAAEFERDVAVAMIVAHDPGLSELAFELSGTIDHMPTCAVASFTFDVDEWGDVGHAEPTTVRFHAPR